MRQHQRAKGFTLLEVLIMATVALLILSLLAQLFIVAVRRTHDGRMRVELQQQGLVVLRQLHKDIEKTSARTMAVNLGDPYVLALTPVEAVTATGSVLWKEEIVSYVHSPASKILHRETYPPQAPVFSEILSPFTPYLPTSGELGAQASTDSGQERILSRYVEEFSLTDRSGGTTSFREQPLILHLKLRRTLSTSDRTADFTIDRRYTLRNDF